MLKFNEVTRGTVERLNILSFWVGFYDDYNVKNRLKEANSEVRDKRMILWALANIDIGVEFINNDPFEKMKQIQKLMHDLQVAISYVEQGIKKIYEGYCANEVHDLPYKDKGVESTSFVGSDQIAVTGEGIDSGIWCSINRIINGCGGSSCARSSTEHSKRRMP
ncbi:hypothetical protein Tco_0992655 [Tanacetum coccineum]|uniref:Uncharacterized protein n=1 Tax=Tanacetum coccineum TaxID=301880 RepID=A0ABQ5F2P8_9ASTR